MHHACPQIIIEYTNVVSGGGVYLPVRYNNGSFVDFSKLEDPSYGYAVFDWSPVSGSRRQT